MPNGWCPFAVRLDGPPEKTGYDGKQKTHAKVGVDLHSMEYESEPQWNDAVTLYNVLFSDREASWTFSIVWFLNGEALFQHYPIGAVCWAQGYQGNLWLDSIELEDISPDGITEGQFALLVKTLRWRAEVEDWPDDWLIGNRHIDFGGTVPFPLLFEHNAVPGAPPTNCQVFTHGQVDPVRLLAALKEDDMDERFTRYLEKQPEAAEIAARQDAWLRVYGVPAVEDPLFMESAKDYIWRLQAKGWTVEPPA